jgi:UvrD/REP helicase N-terminal domain
MSNTCHTLIAPAGPGSGKTRVIVSRVAHLIQQGVNPSRLLVITFTRKVCGLGVTPLFCWWCYMQWWALWRVVHDERHRTACGTRDAVKHEQCMMNGTALHVAQAMQ